MASSQFSLDHKTALVTGGGRGLGFACAESLLEHGAHVMITVRKQEAAEAAVKHLSDLGRCEAIIADLGTAEGIVELGEGVARRHDGVDILVNNAGTNWGAPFVEYPAHAWTKVMQVNVAAPFAVIQQMLALLELRATPENPSRVINIGSIDGHAAGPYDNYAYAASKAALHHMTRVLARRLGPRSITVNCVAPGPIRTAMTAALLDRAEEDIVSAAPLPWLPSASEVGATVVYLAARASASVTGCVVPVDSGLAINTWGKDAE
jgi:NAD(P)-dependent dehydrogenase (short-subunit alcohol dehydrogenase family)